MEVLPHPTPNRSTESRIWWDEIQEQQHRGSLYKHIILCHIQYLSKLLNNFSNHFFVRSMKYDAKSKANEKNKKK
jgi:hypothetical protein